LPVRSGLSEQQQPWSNNRAAPEIGKSRRHPWPARRQILPIGRKSRLYVPVELRSIAIR
jgi:hypothetical protein